MYEASFETFPQRKPYRLIFIPSGSFCLLTTPNQVSQALTAIARWLDLGGKFVFEIETLKTVSEPHGIWKGRWIDRPDGSKIVMSSLTQWDVESRIETIFFRYELWEKNAILQTEVEEFRIRHYEPVEIETILAQHGFTVLDKRQDADGVILYECSLKSNAA